MLSHEVSELAVVTIAEGERVGIISDTHVDPSSGKIVAFSVSEGGGLLHRGSVYRVDAGDIHALGVDALTLPDRSVLRETNDDSLGQTLTLDNLANDKVVTESGTFVGSATAIEFDPEKLALVGVEISEGVLQPNYRIPAKKVISFGQDILIVKDDVIETQSPPPDARIEAERIEPAVGPIPDQIPRNS